MPCRNLCRITWIPGGFPCGLDSKASACNVGDLASIPGSGRSPGEGNGTPLQYPCLENPMDGGAWQATVLGVAKGRTQLSYFTSRESRVIILFEFKGFNFLLWWLFWVNYLHNWFFISSGYLIPESSQSAVFWSIETFYCEGVEPAFSTGQQRLVI